MWKTLASPCSKFIQETVCQISSQLPEFCRRYYRTHFGLFFSWTRCIYLTLHCDLDLRPFDLESLYCIDCDVIRLSSLYQNLTKSNHPRLSYSDLNTENLGADPTLDFMTGGFQSFNQLYLGLKLLIINH